MKKPRLIQCTNCDRVAGPEDDLTAWRIKHYILCPDCIQRAANAHLEPMYVWDRQKGEE